MQVTLDEGYQFGLGAFETIGVEEGRPKLLGMHMERLSHTLEELGIQRTVTEQEVLSFLEGKKADHCALKVMVSQENAVFTMRENPYGEGQRAKGFVMDYSQVMRNETSPLVRHKTFNYGDCILEKRRAGKEGLHELIFLNSRGEICEGTCCNIFFARQGRVYTPSLECGLLPGVVRRVLLELGLACEAVLRPEDVSGMEECFVTNSLMEVMPVVRLGGKEFSGRTLADRCLMQLRSFEA